MFVKKNIVMMCSILLLIACNGKEDGYFPSMEETLRKTSDQVIHDILVEEKMDYVLRRD